MYHACYLQLVSQVLFKIKLTSYGVWRWIAFQKKSDSWRNRPMELLVICELYLKQRLLLDQKDNVNIHCSHP